MVTSRPVGSSVVAGHRGRTEWTETPWEGCRASLDFSLASTSYKTLYVAGTTKVSPLRRVVCSRRVALLLSNGLVSRPLERI